VVESVLADAYGGEGAPGIDGITDPDYASDLADRFGDLHAFYQGLGFAFDVEVSGAVGPAGTATGSDDDRFRWVEASVTWTPAGRSEPTTLRSGVLIAEMSAGAESGSAGGVVKLKNPPTVNTGSFFDTYDPAAGPYGGANVGPEPDIETGATMPELEAPTGLGPLLNEMRYDWEGTSTISSDARTKKLIVSGEHTLRISGSVTILVTQSLEFTGQSRLELMPGATLDLYVEKDAIIDEESVINEAAWDRLRIFNLGNKHFDVDNESRLYADFVSPDAQLHLNNEAQFFGSIVAKKVQAKKQSELHIPTGPSQ